MNPTQRRPRHRLDALAANPSQSDQSGCGLLPDDWEITTLGSLGRTSSGGTPSTSDARFWGGDIPWISSKDMKTSRLHDSINHVTPLALGNGTRLVQPGTILMVVRGMSLAHSFPVAIVEKPVAFNQDLKALVPHPAVDGEFILRWLEANESRILLLATEATHGTKRIPTGDLLAIQIPLPPNDEQRAIAEALSDVDDLLEAMAALIAKKQAIKQATMEQLLTGKTRLPGFGCEWKTKRLGDTWTFLPTANNPRAEFDERGDVEYIHYGDVHACVQPLLDCARGTLPRIQKNRIGNAAELLNGDLVMVDASEDLIGVGKSCEVQGSTDKTVVAGLHTILCRGTSDHWADGFKAYLQFIPAFKSALTRVATGISVYAVSKRQLADVELPLPSRTEQEAIVSILSDMGAEITALEHRLDKVREVKQGMMQQLLTGRVRLVEPETLAGRTAAA